MKPEARFSREFSAALKRMKLFGVRIESSHTAPGFPDWAVFAEGRTVYFELKVDGGKRTKAQVVFHHQLEKRGILVNVLTKLLNTVRLNSIEFNKLDDAVTAAIKGEINVNGAD